MAATSPARLLLIEDEPGLVMTLSDRLSAEGYDVQAATDGESGLTRAATEPFEIIVLDGMLPRRVPKSQTGLGETFQFGDIHVDFRKAEITRAGAQIELSAREFKLLCYFIEHRGATLSRDELLNEVWGYNAMPSTRTVDVHIAWLRQKLEALPRKPQYIHTIHGLGYKFTA